MKTETQIINGLLYEIHEMNERIMTGDICSSKTAMPRATKLSEMAKKDLQKIGCYEIFIDPYQASGGWVGIMYQFKDPAVGEIGGNCVPRRHQ